MDNSYTFAGFSNKPEILEQISKFEAELTKSVGKNIILVAYTPEK